MRGISRICEFEATVCLKYSVRTALPKSFQIITVHLITLIWLLRSMLEFFKNKNKIIIITIIIIIILISLFSVNKFTVKSLQNIIKK